MHELSIVEEVIQTIKKMAEKQNFKKVKTVTLEIGELSCVEVGALEFCFSSASRNTIAEGATLAIQQVPGQGECQHCHATFPYSALYAPCPHCNQYLIKKISGDEMRIKNLEVV